MRATHRVEVVGKRFQIRNGLHLHRRARYGRARGRRDRRERRSGDSEGRKHDNYRRGIWRRDVQCQLICHFVHIVETGASSTLPPASPGEPSTVATPVGPSS